MSSIVEHVELPGIGIRSVFPTAGGQQVGVLVHNTGEKDVLLYAADDPDRCADMMTLNAAESQVMADLLGMSPLGSVADRLLIGGITVTWIEVGSEWRAVGRALPAAEAGLTWLGVVREDTVIPPSSDVVLGARDVIVVAGDRDVHATATHLLESGPG